MSLKVQIITTVYSFIFGILFYIFSKYNYKKVLNKNFAIKFFMANLFSIIFSIIYFLILKKMNEGIIHPYLFLSLILGFFVGRKILKHIAKKEL